jgi:hypothetical protein
MRSFPKKRVHKKRSSGTPRHEHRNVALRARKSGGAPKPLDLRARKIAKQRRKIFTLLVLCTVALASLAALFWFILHTERFVVSVVSVRGTDEISAKEIRELVLNRLQEREDSFFPSTNTFLAPINDIEREIKETNARVKTANILRKGFNELIVLIEEREPFVLYCEDNASVEDGRYSGRCFFADREGVVYLAAPHLKRPEMMLIYFPPSVFENIVLTKPLSKEELDAILSLVKALNREEIESKSIHIVSEDTLKIVTDKGYSLLLLIDDDYSDEFGRFLSVLESDAMEGGVLESIYQFDLRFGRKIFYRYQD